MKNIILLLFFPLISFSQYEKEIDSINKVITTTKDTQIKVDSYRELIQIYLTTDLKKAQKSITNLYQINNKESCEKCLAMADFLQARYFSMSQGSFIDIDNNYKKSTSRSLKIKDYDFYSVVIMHQINHYINKNKMVEADQELKKYLNEAKKINYTDYFNSIYYLYGKLYKKQGYNNLALKNLLLADKYFVYKFADDISVKINDLQEIALFYTDLKNKPKADYYLNESLKLLKKTNQAITVLNSNFRIGEIEYKNKNYKKALYYLTKIMNPKDTVKSLPYKYDIALLMGKTYQELNDLDNASLFTTMAIREFTKKNDTLYLANSLNNNAKINIKKNNFSEAKIDIESAKLLIKNQKINLEYLDIYNTDIEYFKKTKNFEEALKSIKVKDFYLSKYNEKTNLANLNEQDIIYQTEKKEQQIKLLSTENELAQKQKYIYIALLGLLAIIGGSLFYGYRNKIKTAQKLNELSELKSRFFANISHEFRTPLTLIKSPVQSLQSEITNENQKNKLDLIDKNSNRMLELVDQLLELSKLDSGKLQLILKEGNIASFLNSLVDSFSFQATENKLSLTSTIEKNTINHHFDKDVIEKIVTNLLSNAIKYTSENEKISFDSKIENNQLQLVVSNSGSEIKKEDLPKLFERFYQKKENHQGVGIGLALVKELVELYKGKIETNVENGILSFTVSLSLEKANKNAIVVTTEVQKAIISDENNNETELPILLIVDDNQDVRTVLKDIFASNYQILEAEDGDQALKIAKAAIPDCIISDVMMPKMDGFEFTKQIKNNELTSFIPVIF